MRRKLILCTSALLLAIGSAFAAADSATTSAPDVERAVAARSLAFVKAALNGDVAGFRYPNGRLARLDDPDGNPIVLWELAK